MYADLSPEDVAYLKALPGYVQNRIWDDHQARARWSREIIIKRQHQSLCRAIAKHLKRNHYWPTLRNLAKKSYARLGHRRGEKRMYLAMALCVSDLVETGHLQVLMGQRRIIALTDKGWSEYTPYVPAEPDRSNDPVIRKNAKRYMRMVKRAQKIYGQMEQEAV